MHACILLLGLKRIADLSLGPTEFCLLQAEEDPSLLIDLLRHVSSMLRILRWGSGEEHSQYVSIWSKLISLCNQELKHGALLWKQALEKDVRSQLLSKSEGIISSNIN